MESGHPRAILVPRSNSHPFESRRLQLNQTVVVGRAVAKCKPQCDNAIFDCKVLSRNHAVLWYDNGKFYLRDTRSSNGTFVNSQRLSPASEESSAQEIFTDDMIQFGVEVMESIRNVTHSCIVLTIKLYLPDGSEAMRLPRNIINDLMLSNNSLNVIPSSTTTTTTSNSSTALYADLASLLREAEIRELMLREKLGTIEDVLCNAHAAVDEIWSVCIGEDLLLSDYLRDNELKDKRIDNLRFQLEVLESMQRQHEDKAKQLENELNEKSQHLDKLLAQIDVINQDKEALTRQLNSYKDNLLSIVVTICVFACMYAFMW